MEIFDNFCSVVTGRLDHATEKEKRGVAEELRAHLEDHAAAAMDGGRSEDEARAHAVEAMGRAEEVGDALNKEFPLVWLVLSRAAALLAVLLAVFVLFAARDVWYILGDSLRARYAPESLYAESYQNPIDVRVEVPNTNDIAYFFACGIEHYEGYGYYAVIGMVCYDRNILGQVSNYSGDFEFENYRPEETRYPQAAYDARNGSFQSYGLYQTEWVVPVEYGQSSVAAVYERAGASVSAEIPLGWEGVE